MSILEILDFFQSKIEVCNDYIKYIEASYRQFDLSQYQESSKQAQLESFLSLEKNQSIIQNQAISAWKIGVDGGLKELYTIHGLFFKEHGFSNYFLSNYKNIQNSISKSNLDLDQANQIYEIVLSFVLKLSYIKDSLNYIRDLIYGDQNFAGLSINELLEKFEKNKFVDGLSKEQIQNLFDFSGTTFYSSEELSQERKIEFLPTIKKTGKISILDYLDFLISNISSVLETYVNLLNKIVTIKLQLLNESTVDRG